MLLLCYLVNLGGRPLLLLQVDSRLRQCVKWHKSCAWHTLGCPNFAKFRATCDGFTKPPGQA